MTRRARDVMRERSGYLGTTAHPPPPPVSGRKKACLLASLYHRGVCLGVRERKRGREGESLSHVRRASVCGARVVYYMHDGFITLTHPAALDQPHTTTTAAATMLIF